MAEAKTAKSKVTIIEALIKQWLQSQEGLTAYKKWLATQPNNALEALRITLESVNNNWADWSGYFEHTKMQAFIIQTVALFNEKLASASNAVQASTQITPFLNAINVLLRHYPAQKHAPGVCAIRLLSKPE